MRSRLRAAFSAQRTPLFRALGTGVLAVVLGLLAAGESRAASELDASAEELRSDEIFAGKRLDEVRVEFVDSSWTTPVKPAIAAGESYEREKVRLELERLTRLGRYANVSAELILEEGRLVLVFGLTERRLVKEVRVIGSGELADEARVSLNFSRADELTAARLEEAEKRVLEFYQQSGYPRARVSVRTEETDDPLLVLVVVDVQAGEPEFVVTRRILVNPVVPSPAESALLAKLPNIVGARFDDRKLKDDTRAIHELLEEGGYFLADVSERVLPGGVVETRIVLGPRYTVRFSGYRMAGLDDLERALGTDVRKQTSAEEIQSAIETFYRRRGHLDAEAHIRRTTAPDGREVVFDVAIQEGDRFVVASRAYPCLERDLPLELDQEIEGVLKEEFETAGLFQAPGRRVVESSLEGRGGEALAVPFESRPHASYSPEAFEAVEKHLRELFVAEGYFLAEVGKSELSRGRCRFGTSGRECVVEREPQQFPLVCEAPELIKRRVVESACTTDRKLGRFCAPTGAVVLPMLAGPRATVHDIAFAGNDHFSSETLRKISGLELATPARRESLEAARSLIAAYYAEEGYAFAAVEATYEVSDDGRRARAHFTVTERLPVTVKEIRIVGATRTRTGLIESRIRLEKGGLYRRSLVESSQRLIESLGVFASVSIGLEDPAVFSKEKVVVVTVTERMAQYLDVRGGLSTGEGVRVGLEYGHRNLGGGAIGLTLGVQLGLRPPFMLVEPDVRAKYEELVDSKGLGQLLERRNSLLFAFPETGLGPLFRGEVEGVDIRSNQRDFGIQKDAAILRLIFRPYRTVSLQVSAAAEANNAMIFGSDQKQSFKDYVSENPQFSGVIRVPEGESVAFPQGVDIAWDRRDRPLAAHRGTLLSFGVEHVTAVPSGSSSRPCDATTTSAFAPSCSELLRFTGRAAAYFPLYRGAVRKSGPVLAVSVRGGIISHLTDTSHAYPDRLFYVGGADTVRGFQLASMVPEEYAEQLLDPNANFYITQVVVRGGDVFANPRAEVRIPVVAPIDTVLFVDAGNLWLSAQNLDLSKLRYTVGTGLRVDTPVGPLVFDYGLNVTRVLDSLLGRTDGLRYWESMGEFHFSIGLF